MAPIILLVGASSLEKTLKRYPYVHQRYERSVKITTPSGPIRSIPIKFLAIPGLSVNPKAPLHLQRSDIPTGASVILWHDVINNTITKHPKKRHIPLTADQLVVQLEAIPNLSGIVYIQREGANNIFPALVKSRFPTVHITRDLLSRRKQRDPEITEPYKKLHILPKLEVLTLTTIRRFDYDINRIVQKNKRPSQKKRKQLANSTQQ